MKRPPVSPDALQSGDGSNLGATARATDEAGALALGTRVGGYRIERELGRGGLAVVYAAAQPESGKRAVIKVLAAPACADPALLRRCIGAAQAVDRLQHPNIVRLLDLGRLADGRPYFALEYLEGETLAAHIAGGPLAPSTACRLLAQAADALEAAHARRVVHRDLKPENLWLETSRGGEPHVKVLDFGIGKLLGAIPADGPAGIGASSAAPRYLAPEQCMGHRVDARADVYALGAILYRVVTGEPPFRGSSFAELVSQQVLATPRRPAELRALPAALDALIMACLEKEPCDRPQRAANLAAHLREIAAHPQAEGSGVKPRPAAQAAASGTRRRRRRGLSPLAIGLLLAMAAAFAAYQVGSCRVGAETPSATG